VTSPPTEGRTFVGSAMATAALQVATMLSGVLLAVLVVRKFGQTPTTDGLFAAYAVYTLLLVFAQTLRTSIVPRLGEGDELLPALERHAGAVLLVAALSALPLLLLAGPLAEALTGSLAAEATDAAETALRILWIAAAAQLVAGLASAALAVRGRVVLPGAAYLTGGLVACAFLLVFSDSLGGEALPWGLALGSAISAAIVSIRLATLGDRIRVRRIRTNRAAARAAWTMLLGAVASLIGQAGYAVSLAYAARIGEGAVTLYSYAFFASMLVMGATAIPAGMVLVAPLSQTWERRTELLERPLIEVTRTGLTLVAPLPALAIVAGPDVVQAVLGDAISRGDAETIVYVTLALCGVVVGSLLGTVPMIAAFAAHRYRGVAIAALSALAVQVVLSLIAVATDELVVLGVMTSIAGLEFLAAVVYVVYGREAGSVLARMGIEVARVLVATVLAFAPAVIAAGAGAGIGVGLVLWVAGCALLAGILRAKLPDHWELVMRLRYSLRRGPVPS
jgi:peptidoglycan biosynthesis protein MviN/MurJ (putative lipid II flippase)